MISNNHLVMPFITAQIIVGIANVQRFQGGKDYPTPFEGVIGVAEVLNLQIFRILHLDCHAENYADELVVSSLVPLSMCMLLVSVRYITKGKGEKRIIGKGH